MKVKIKNCFLIKIKTQIVILTLLFNVSYAQNLVKNPSFENLNDLDFFNYKKDRIVDWYGVRGHLTYTLTNNPITISREHNHRGEVYVFDGSAMVGMYSSFLVLGTLNAKLHKDSIYLVSFYYHLAPKSDFYTDSFAFGFVSEDLIEDNIELFKNLESKVIHNYYERNKLQIVACENCKEKSWQKFETLYRAKGEEVAIVMGIFEEINNEKLYTPIKLLPQSAMNKPSLIAGYKNAYYYIDLVSVTNYKKEFQTDKEFSTYDILFETASSSIKENSKYYLDSLVRFLKLNSHLKIEISGHTDNIGNPKNNEILSKQRAEAVELYLIQKGINKNRITTIGYGDTKPIKSNQTAAGRAKNRRITIKFKN